MTNTLRRLWIASGVIASALCLFAGVWLLTATGFDHEDNAWATAIGLYFIGKAFFVGPLLIITATRSSL